MIPVSSTIAWKEALKVRMEVEKALESIDKKHSRLKLHQVDQLRLLNLKTWSLRYYLPVREIVRLLLPILRGQLKPRKVYWGLGVTATMLTGDGAERILLREINKLYPNAEHIAMWRQDEQERQLIVERDESLDGIALRFRRVLSVMASVSPERFVRKYKRQIRFARRANRDNEVAHSRRNYRWSPWV